MLPIRNRWPLFIADTVRPDSRAAVEQLKRMCVNRRILISRDQATVAETIGRALGADRVHAKVLPQYKLELIRELQAQGSIKTWVQEGRDCADILVQIAAVRSALSQLGRVVLEDRVESCLLTAAAEGTADDVWADLQRALGVFLRTWRLPRPGIRLHTGDWGSIAHR